MARIDVEIEDYLGEVDYKYLLEEIKKRKEFEKFKEDLIDENMPQYVIPKFKTSDDILKFIKIVLGLKPWHTKERVIKEIENL